MYLIPPFPDVGNHPSCTAKIHININPTANVGADCPSIANIFAPLSNHESFFTADNTPIGNAITPVIINANADNCIVAGNFSTIRSSTGRSHLNDVPKSPVSNRLMYVRYCTCSGWSKPHSFRTRSSCSFDASSSKIAANGSPAIRDSANTIRLMTNTASNPCNIRNTINRCMMFSPTDV